MRLDPFVDTVQHQAVDARRVPTPDFFEPAAGIASLVVAHRSARGGSGLASST
ncbi:MAG TPA: hypothetical protein VNF07_08130 [Acidimicrobiales bacterium]|nr:hypothetical protein [Acidimicrobiales bacterium]